MKICVTFTNQKNNIDICCDNQNLISNVLDELLKEHLLDFDNLNYIYSKRLKMKIPTNLSFCEANILNGDKIEL